MSGVEVPVSDREEMDRMQERLRVMEARVLVLEAEREEQVSVKQRVELLERMIESRGGKFEKKTKMIEAKDLKPLTLKKKEEWKVWQEKTMRFAEAVHKGMKQKLEKWKDHKEEIAEDDMEESWWEKRSELWSYLEEYTEGDAQKLVKCIKKENGWEAWRRLNKHF